MKWKSNIYILARLTEEKILFEHLFPNSVLCLVCIIKQIKQFSGTTNFRNVCLWGPDKLYRKIPWDFLRGKTPKFRGMCQYYFSAPPNIFHNFVSFHPILMFLTILESGDKTNNIGDEFKKIRLILINTYRYLGSFYSFSDMKTYFGLWKKI